MMINPYVLATLAALAYVFAVDDNVAPFVVLQFKRLGLSARRAIWMAQNNPDLPWVRYSINRRAWRIAEELQQSFNSPKGESEVG